MKASFKVNIPPVFYLWVGQGISSIGSMVYNIALAWYVMKQTGSPLVMGTVLLVGMVPKIVLSIIAGIVGDKVSKKKFLIIVDLLRFTLTTAWGISLIGRTFNLVEVYIFTFSLSMVDAVFNPVYGALIPELIKKDNVTWAASINQMVFRTATILAPSVAGFAIMLLNFSQFVLFNGITFLYKLNERK
ncbi:MFS transporter [Paenibacillus larvae]|uniref:Putative MFS-type transporter n=1 Tax=Paenibacillus larvae subsp. larvae TaxID=147375 RepID=A0A6C0QU74_9BACL|nr:MFS transporter [Paenibacillus larvae]QHZ51796.1 putative MFS-type transporter [Paenibacillus larvae subsp. larvae]